ncbi:hypothetical protein NUW54_g6836 [Trametes sanguinea]|uniref:Uncharacterized protein n=1 Tax=Trametes sanguinea TaxID=158606 RepID=A0ACC1PTV9_9APHY|nr:hypothetical protein NUW54_g6836 [Trametes sanguinea]
MKRINGSRTSMMSSYEVQSGTRCTQSGKKNTNSTVLVHGGVGAQSVRYGHSAMVSGIDSLATTHEQIVIGWTGDIQASSAAQPPVATAVSSDPSGLPTSKVATSSLTEEDKKELETMLEEYKSRDEPENGKKIHYVPVWLDDKDAHGHYDGYCKQSEYTFLPLSLVPPNAPLRFR